MPGFDDQRLAELIGRVRQGDGAAQHELWHGYYDGLCVVCQRILGPGVQANEIATEVLSDFLADYVHRLEHPPATWSYLRLIAARRAAKLTRPETQPLSADMNDFPDDSDVATDEATTYRLLMPALEHCLGQLRPKAQQVLKLRYYAGLTHAEIGQRVGGSKQYIGRLAGQCLELLRRCLERERQSENRRRRRRGVQP